MIIVIMSLLLREMNMNPTTTATATAIATILVVLTVLILNALIRAIVTLIKTENTMTLPAQTQNVPIHRTPMTTCILITELLAMLVLVASFTGQGDHFIPLA